MPAGPGRPGRHGDRGRASGVPPDYDPLIAKVMVHAADRDAAIDRLRRALDETEIGGIQTTLPVPPCDRRGPGVPAGRRSRRAGSTSTGTARRSGPRRPDRRCWPPAWPAIDAGRRPAHGGAGPAPGRRRHRRWPRRRRQAVRRRRPRTTTAAADLGAERGGRSAAVGVRDERRRCGPGAPGSTDRPRAELAVDPRPGLGPAAAQPRHRRGRADRPTRLPGSSRHAATGGRDAGRCRRRRSAPSAPVVATDAGCAGHRLPRSCRRGGVGPIGRRRARGHRRRLAGRGGDRARARAALRERAARRDGGRPSGPVEVRAIIPGAGRRARVAAGRRRDGRPAAARRRGDEDAERAPGPAGRARSSGSRSRGGTVEVGDLLLVLAVSHERAASRAATPAASAGGRTTRATAARGRRRSAASGSRRRSGHRDRATCTRRPTWPASTRTATSAGRASTRSPAASSRRCTAAGFWTMRQYAGFATAAETNERFRYLLEQGQTGLSVAFDLPTQMGYDSDAPEADGRGRPGRRPDQLAWPTWRRCSTGIPLERGQHVDDDQRDRGDPARPVRRRGRAAGRRRASVSRHDPERHPQGVHRPRDVHLPAPAVDAPGDRHLRVLRRASCRAGTRSASPATTCARPGATAAQELAFTLADAIAYVEAAVARGPRRRRLRAAGCRFFFAAWSELFEEVAKFRAARRMWARIVRDRFGARNPRSHDVPLPRPDRRLAA